jgi:hypothetical protein
MFFDVFSAFFLSCTTIFGGSSPIAPLVGNRAEPSFGISFCTAHPFHASVCLVEHNPSERTLEISLKLFADDLDIAMEQQFGKRFFLATPAERAETNEYLLNYLRDHLQFIVNGSPRLFVFVGKESPDGADFELWCYLEITDVDRLSDISFSNSLLVDRFNDQTNIVKIKANGRQESCVMNLWNKSGQFRF